MKAFINRLRISLKEIFNLITNILAPVTSLLILILELIPVVPMTWIHILKKVEYWLFYAAGTAKDIEEAINKKLP